MNDPHGASESSLPQVPSVAAPSAAGFRNVADDATIPPHGRYSSFSSEFSSRANLANRECPLQFTSQDAESTREIGESLGV
jgi:hypothetical protein